MRLDTRVQAFKAIVSAATEHARIVTIYGSVPFVVSAMMILAYVGPNRA